MSRRHDSPIHVQSEEVPDRQSFTSLKKKEQAGWFDKNSAEKLPMGDGKMLYIDERGRCIVSDGDNWTEVKTKLAVELIRDRKPSRYKVECPFEILYMPNSDFTCTKCHQAIQAVLYTLRDKTSGALSGDLCGPCHLLEAHERWPLEVNPLRPLPQPNA